MKCAVYIRVSTSKEEQQSSIENQSLLFRQYTTDREWTIVEEYVDIESGTTEKRDSFQRLLNDISLKKFDCILAKELSRFARNGRISYDLREHCFNNNIHFITLDGAINTLEQSHSMFGLYSWFSEQEAQKTSDRTKVALSALARSGHFMGSIAPYGYYINNKQLIIRNDETPLIVKRIFNLYLEGWGCDKIANQLTLEGIPTPSEIIEKSNASPIWHGSTIRLILTNRHYTGTLVQGKETTVSVTCKKRRKVVSDDLIVVKDTHEPIITTQLFDSVQTLLLQRKSVRPSPQLRLFSNLLFCVDCGKGMHYRSERQGYICGTYSKRGKHFCTSHIIKEESLKKSVLQDINYLLSTSSITHTKKEVKSLLDKQKKLISKSVRSLQKEYLSATRLNELALKKMVMGTISSEEYTLFISSQEQNTSVMENKIQSNTLLLEQLSSPSTLEALHTIIEQRTLTNLTPSIVNLFISRIEIGENDYIRIHYKFHHNC